MVQCLILFLIFYSNAGSRQEYPIKVEGFDAAIWKLDSLGCQRKRHSLATILTQNKQKLINQKKTAIESFLGKANSGYMDGRFDSYYIEEGIQCTHKKKDETGYVEVTRLLIEYKKESAVNVSIITP